MKNKLENLLSFNDFTSNWNDNKAKNTKRTDTGIDVIKEGVEEIVPANPVDDDLSNISKFSIDTDEKVDKISGQLESLEDDKIEDISNYLREVLLELEQQGFIDQDYTDDLDDKYDGDWISWINEVIVLPELPEDSLNGVLDIIGDVESEDFNEEDDDVDLIIDEDELDED